MENENNFIKCSAFGIRIQTFDRVLRVQHSRGETCLRSATGEQFLGFCLGPPLFGRGEGEEPVVWRARGAL
jgi:hypothetical protein